MSFPPFPRSYTVCGIFGYVPASSDCVPDVDVMTALAAANAQRGRDACGLALVRPGGEPARVLKTSESIDDVLRSGPYLRAVRAYVRGWPGAAILAHTRAATQGAHNQRNAHPFRRGAVAVTHNGQAQGMPRDRCDSIGIARALRDAAPGDARSALGDVRGYWSLAWSDRRTDCVYLLCGQSGLSSVRTAEGVYYSSSAEHLRDATGADEVEVWRDGEFRAWRLIPGGATHCETLPEFRAAPRVTVTRGVWWPESDEHRPGWEQWYDRRAPVRAPAAALAPAPAKPAAPVERKGRRKHRGKLLRAAHRAAQRAGYHSVHHYWSHHPEIADSFLGAAHYLTAWRYDETLRD